MDKFDYITATIEEEKIRLEKIINYLKETNNLDELPEYQERYNNILKYLTAKERYLKVLTSIKNIKTNDGKEGVKSKPKKADKKVGRNDLCPCGSGRKYKQCCGK